MPFSHHSHSGEFCPGHAQDSLEDIVKIAVAKNFRVLALTEHMPRHDQDLYPEEIKAGTSLELMTRNEQRYVQRAQELRIKYRDQIELLIGFESDWCGERSHGLIVQSLQAHQFDFYVGSIHHVDGIPIDYDHLQYERAKVLAGGTDEKLFERYYDEQLEMLSALRPVVVGHFDLIRLKSRDFNLDWQSLTVVWGKILRNLDFVASYGGILEINTAAVRKGMTEPYPKSEICQAFMERNGRFCLSDDSHGVEQVATNYDKILPFLRRNQITSLTYLSSAPSQEKPADNRFPNLSIESVLVDDIADHKVFRGCLM